MNSNQTENKFEVFWCRNKQKKSSKSHNTTIFKDQTEFSYESTFISYICICTPKVQHLLICRNTFFCIP